GFLRPNGEEHGRAREASGGPHQLLDERRRSAVRELRRPVQEVLGEVRAGSSGADPTGVSSPFRFDVLTLFPEIFDGFLGQSILKLAQERALVQVPSWTSRDWSPRAKHHKVDDRPFGGGPGMVIMPEPVFTAVEAVQAMAEPGLLVMLTPAGERLTQSLVAELAGNKRLLLLCGRYEGFD